MAGVDIEKLMDRIRADVPDVLAIYSFGSFGTASARQDSDIDLAVLPREPLPQADCWKLTEELAVIAGKDVDLIDLRSVSTVMRAQVVSSGRRLYCADPKRCAEFEDYVYSAYARLNEERRGILQAIHQRGAVHGG